MRRILLAVALLLGTASPVAAQSNDVRVRLYWLQPPESLRLVARPGEARLRRCSPCQDVPAAESFDIKAVGNQVEVKATSAGKPATWQGQSVEVEGAYRLEVPGGAALRLPYPLFLRAHHDQLLLTVALPMEDYVAGVLAGESSGFSSVESLKAMAVAARSYAARFRGRHQAEGFDFCDTTHCQDLRLTAVTPRLQEATAATEGEMMWYEAAGGYLLPPAMWRHEAGAGRTCARPTFASRQTASAWRGTRASGSRKSAGPS
jgi:hypothetical protein